MITEHYFTLWCCDSILNFCEPKSLFIWTVTNELHAAIKGENKNKRKINKMKKNFTKNRHKNFKMVED